MLKKDTTILLTGATGYLGSRLGNMLLEEGYSVIAVHLNHYENFKYNPKYEACVKTFFLSDSSVKDCFSNNKIDGIIHTATIYGRSGETPADIIKSNVEFPVEIISNAIEKNVKFFINTDSILNKYISPYALSKSNLTEWMKMYDNKMKMINIKLDHFYGPKDKNTKFIAYMLEKLTQNVKEIDLTEGWQKRDFIYIDDVVEVYKIILENIDKIANDNMATFEIGTNKKTSIRYISKKLKELTNSKTILNFGAIPFRKNEMLDYEINTTAIELIGWKPKTDIDKGLELVVNAHKEKTFE